MPMCPSNAWLSEVQGCTSIEENMYQKYHGEDKGATDTLSMCEGCWQDQTLTLLTLALQNSHGSGGGRGRAQQLIKPGLMALTPTHNPGKQSPGGRKVKVCILLESRRNSELGYLAGFHLFVHYKIRWNSANQDFSKCIPLNMSLSLYLKEASHLKLWL